MKNYYLTHKKITVKSLYQILLILKQFKKYIEFLDQEISVFIYLFILLWFVKIF